MIEVKMKKMVMKTRMSDDDMFRLAEEFEALDDEMLKALPYLHDDVEDDNIFQYTLEGVRDEGNNSHWISWTNEEI